jgi:UDP-N-acetylmuramate--alanine ligase
LGIQNILSVRLINNIEMYHPEFFKDFEEFRGSFKKFIQRIKSPKILIVNQESDGIQTLLKEMSDWLKKNKVRVIGYFLNEKYNFPFQHQYRGEITKTTPAFTYFKVKTPVGEEEFRLGIPGIHNVANALGIIACAVELGVDLKEVKKALADFKGLGRRFDLVGEASGVKVFDDYAVHPTAVEATIRAAKQQYPNSRIWAVLEPHQFSRLYLFLDGFASALDQADQVIVTKIYPGREKDTGKIKAEDLVEKIGSKAEYIKEFKKVAQKISRESKKGDLVIVFGAGKSYLLSQEIIKELKKIGKNES